MRRARRVFAAVACAAAGLVAVDGAAQRTYGAPAAFGVGQGPLTVTPTLSGELSWTDNVDLQPRDQQRSDLVLQITPGLRVDYAGARAHLSGSISAPILLYARTGEHNNQVLPNANLDGGVEVVKDFFFVDASANVSQTYFNPFGPRPASITSATENRYTQATYRVTPRIQGELGGNIVYRLRDDNIWTELGDAPSGAERSYVNALVGSIDRAPTPIGWGVDINRTQYEFPDQDEAQLQEHARVRVVYRPSPVWQLFASGGYEHNRFTFTETDGATYGVGVGWRPNERTFLDAGWEHRFFGESYYFTFNHRGPRTTVALRASRNITSYPEQLARLGTGAFVPGILFQILASRIPDPSERSRFILEFMRERGLPVFLSQPLSLYAQQIYLQEDASATYGIVGVRNTVFFSVYRTKTEPVTGAGVSLPPAQGGITNNTQIGGGAVWTYALTPTSSLSLSADASRTEANAPFAGQTDQWSVRLSLTRPISPRTSAYAGVRYVALDSNLQEGYREFAVLIGASHTFR